jgi:hypothetical protein
MREWSLSRSAANAIDDVVPDSVRLQQLEQALRVSRYARWRRALQSPAIRYRKPSAARHFSVSWNLMLGCNPLLGLPAARAQNDSGTLATSHRHERPRSGWRACADRRGSTHHFFFAGFDLATLPRAFFAAGFTRALAGVCAGVAGAGDRA